MKEASNVIKIEAEELGGSLQQRHQRPTKNSEVTTVSADLVSAGIGTASANVSAITSEEQEQQPQLQQSVPCEEEIGDSQKVIMLFCLSIYSVRESVIKLNLLASQCISTRLRG